MILSASSIVFAVKYWQFPNDGGTQLVTEENRELIGESIQGTALVYDSEGNLINKEDAESVSGLYDWENCPMIQQIEDETAIPSTFTVIPVKKRGSYCVALLPFVHHLCIFNVYGIGVDE